MPAATCLMLVLLALLPTLAALAALPLRRLPPVCRRLFAAAAAGMQIATALFLLLLPALAAASALPRPIWLPSCGGVMLGTALPLLGGSKPQAAPPSALPQLLPPAIALGALAAVLPHTGYITLYAAAATIAAQYCAENLLPPDKQLYTCFMHTTADHLPAAAALLTAYAAATQLPLLQVLLPSLGAGAMLCRAVAQTIPQLQQSYRDNLCTLCIALGFALVLLLYAVSR